MASTLVSIVTLGPHGLDSKEPKACSLWRDFPCSPMHRHRHNTSFGDMAKESDITKRLTRMHSEGFSFNSGGLGVEPCSQPVVSAFATVRGRALRRWHWLSARKTANPPNAAPVQEFTLPPTSQNDGICDESDDHPPSKNLSKSFAQCGQISGDTTTTNDETEHAKRTQVQPPDPQL